MNSIKILALLVLFAGISACYYDNFEEINPGLGLQGCDTAGTITYAITIKPIMDSYCGTNNSACHNSTGSGGYDLTSIAGIEVAHADGVLLPSIKHTGPRPMPKNGGQLSNCDINAIEKWLNTGRTP